MVSLEDVIRAYRRLEKLEPKNELLTYMRIDSENSVAWPKQAYKEFIERYVRKTIYDNPGDVNLAYLNELTDAIKRAKAKEAEKSAPKKNSARIIIPKPGQTYQSKFFKP